ncbi:MAG: M23 family metallopeptidase [Granulosicoccus sp.]|nr:M23 family metallopeptidase [Granulosicoccus sp.]
MMATKFRSRVRRSAGLIVISLIAATMLTACATVEQTDIGQRLSDIGSSVKQGVTNISPLRSGSGKKNPGDASRIAAQFPPDQMPHTMMAKPVAAGRLTSGFGYRINPKGIRIPRRHKGIDYAAPIGTEVYAAESGVVDKKYLSKSYGNYVRIKHENDFYTAYAHLDSIVDGLAEGTPVTRGQVIGKVGTTGKSSGPHLHFELIHKGSFIDPLFARPAVEQATNQ